jgi:protease-4
VGLVASRRGIDTASVAGLEQGRVYSGREAVANKLVDQIGGEPEAVKYLEEKRNIPKGLKVVDFKPKAESSWGLMGLSLAALGRLIGDRTAGEIGHLLDTNDTLGRLRLDGLLSLWQGSER